MAQTRAEPAPGCEVLSLSRERYRSGTGALCEVLIPTIPTSEEGWTFCCNARDVFLTANFFF